MGFFGLDKASKHPEGLELLTTVYDNVEFAIVRGILEGAGIPYLVKERGSGSSVKIIAGYSMFGTDIFVRKDDLDTAAELIAPEGEGAEISEDGGENENESSSGTEDSNIGGSKK
jgi:hypothetical protein